RGRNGEMGQGDPSGQHQGGLNRADGARYSVTPVPRMRPDDRLESPTTQAVIVTPPCMSASPRKRPSQIKMDPPLRAIRVLTHPRIRALPRHSSSRNWGGATDVDDEILLPRSRLGECP